MQCEYIALLVLWAVVLVGVGSAPNLSSNYNISTINDFALVSPPLQVPLSLPRNSDPLPHTPIHQKYNLQHYRKPPNNLHPPSLKTRMLHVDYQLLYEEEPPPNFLQDQYQQDYHLLESREFVIMLSNPSELFTICLLEVFSDCESIKKALKRHLPICINPYTKYPLHFNLYVTAAKNRETIKSAIFFNATIKHEYVSLLNRIWMKEVRFNLLPNHLKLYSFELRNCRQEHSVVSIKNPEKNDLILMIVYKHKKLYMNNQPFDEKVTVGAGKIFRFMIEGRDATMTIYTHNPGQHGKVYPILYVPLYCLEQLTIEYVPVGIISAPNLALIYPLLVTSHSSSPIHIQEIDLLSSSQAIELYKSTAHKLTVHSNEKFVQIGAFVVRATKHPQFRNTIAIRILFKYTNHQNTSQLAQVTRNLTYTEMQNPIEVGRNRYYDVTKMKEGEYNQTEKIEHFNYSVINRMQIPIRLERILFNSQRFRMHWFRFSGTYIYPERIKEEILLEYIGPRNLPISPVKYAAAIELSGGMFVPFEVMVFDNTLTCLYQGKEDRCSKLKLISFGYQKTDQKVQMQTVTFKNHNPNNITLRLEPYSLPHKNINFSVTFDKPFPYYQGSLTHENTITKIQLRSGHTINMTIQVRVTKTIVGDMLLSLNTPYEKITPKIRFHFQTGKLAFSHQTVQIPQSDFVHQGVLNFTSTFQDTYTIKEVISSTSKLEFQYNESEEHEQLECVLIPYTYNPYRDNNITEECCGEDFIKNYYLNSITSDQDSNSLQRYEVSVVTSSDMQQKTYINVKPMHTSLLHLQNKHLNLNVLKANSGGHFCLTIKNPYPTPLKYSISFLPHIVVEKTKDYFNYLKHAKRQRVDAYFCVKGQGRSLNPLTPASLKQLFRLQDKPTELLLGKDGSFTDSNPAERTNLSNNDYLNSFAQTGKETCYKFLSVLYMKLLIQSEVVNDLLDRYPLEFTEKFMEREHQHLHDSVFTKFYDEFYAQMPLTLERYCTAGVYPIFRFCQQIPLKPVSPVLSMQPPPRKPKRSSRQFSPSRVLAEQREQQTCYMLHGHKTVSELSFQLLLSNNYSKYDDYTVSLSLVEPKIQVGDIAFEEKRLINHTTFLKHYFSSLYRAIREEDQTHLVKQNGIIHKASIIPVYFTNQDYDQHFGVFRGDRYFQLVNLAAIDIEFTHYGFENIQNTRFFSGFSIQQAGMPPNKLLLLANSKSTFRIAFNVDRNFPLNISNPIMHHHINLYLYRSNQYYIHLHLVIKVADNILAKIKTQEEEKQYQSNSVGYVLINFVSLTFICAVISQLKREEQEKQGRLKATKEKLKKIQIASEHSTEKQPNVDYGFDLTEQKIKKHVRILPPTSIGTHLKVQLEKKQKPYSIISEEDLAFFKNYKIKQDRSIISDSSESEQFRLSQTQSEKYRAEQEQKSQYSAEKSQVSEIKPENEEIDSSKTDRFDEEYDEDGSSDHNGSQHSLTESILPDGISVCNQQMDIDENMDFQFGFGKQNNNKKAEDKANEDQYVYYNVFSSHNPLKKDHQPFPWMTQNQKKKVQRPKHRKEQ